MSLFRPASGCGPACLPAASPRVGPLRFAARLVAATSVLLFFLVAPGRPALVRVAARALLASLGLALGVRGKPRSGLLVANHISWIDIVAVMALEGDVRLVAKKEIGTWPVIGALAARQNAIFLDRQAPRQLSIAVGEATRALRAGATVAVFPEGTTGCGQCPVPMRPAFFQAALDAGVPVTAVTLSFTASGQPSTVAAFVGEESLMTSVRRLAWARGVRLDVVASAPIFPDAGADRRSLARMAAAEIGTRDISRVAVPLGSARREVLMA